MNWTVRTNQPNTVKRRATWAAVALALVSVIAQVVNLVRVDLKPISDKLDQVNEKVSRIETKLEDHERRIQRLEEKRARGGEQPPSAEQTERERSGR